MQNENSDGPSLVLRATGYPIAIIRPGQTFKIGRDRRNDYVLSDATVSRFHAAIIWSDNNRFPRFCDSESTAGSKIDGHIVKYKHLTSVHDIQLGSTVISAEYAHTESLVPTQVDLPLLKAYSKAIQSGKHALLTESDDDNSVTFFKEYGSQDEQGVVSSNEALHKLLIYLEDTHRTGTLHLQGTRDAWLIYAIGKIKRAQCGPQIGEGAFQTIVAMPNANYRFTVQCDVGEAPLNISAACYLRALRLSSTQRRSRRYGRIKRPKN